MARPTVTNRAFNPTDGSLANDPVLYLSKLFVYFLQNLFRDFPEGSGMKWSPEDENSEIIIGAEKPTVNALEKTPHITCVLGASRWSNLGFDQMFHTEFGTGERTHTDLMPATMAYHCQAKNGMHARRVAWNASFYTNIFRRILMKSGGLHHVAPNHEISSESPATAYTGQLASSELVSVVVTVPFYWQPKWVIKDPAELWRNLRVDIRVLEARGFERRTMFIREPLGGRRIIRIRMDQRPDEEAFVQTQWDDPLTESEE